MKRFLSAILRAVRRPLALGAAFAAYALLPLSGCMGGTSTEVGNPIALVFYQDGKRAKFDGFLSLVVAGSNPEFYYSYPKASPKNGATSPIVLFGSGSGSGSGSATVRLTGSDSIVLDRELIESWLYSRDQLPLNKTAAGLDAPGDNGLPAFNIILQGSGKGDPGKFPGAWLAGVQARDRGYSTAAGDSGRVFEIELTPGHRCTGEVDTASASGRPLALFVPGSPYLALVQDGRFEFDGLPAGRLPLRWVTGDGRIFAVPESLGVEGGGPTPAEYAISGPVHAGARIDSIAMPVPYPTLALPSADPAGPYYFSDSVVVSLSAQAGAAIYYAKDDTTPAQNWKKYTEPLVMRSSTTLRAMARASGYNPSPVAVNNYVLAPARPVFSPAAGRFVDSVRVTIAGPAGSTLHFTLDGSAPTAASPIYGGPLTLRATTIVQAIASLPGLGSSAAVSSEYVIESPPPATP